MGVFGDWAEKYWDIGLATFPCGTGPQGKGPYIEEWSDWCTAKPSEEMFLGYLKRFSHAQKIGLPLGPANGLVAFDFDYEYKPDKAQISEKEFQKDLRDIERKVMSVLPYTPVKKIGKKGFTSFYKWSPQLLNLQCDRHGVRLFDFLCEGRQTIIPPSLHSIVNDKALHYKWIEQDLMFALDDIPEIEMELIKELKFLLGNKSEKKSAGRHDDLFWYAVDMVKVEKDRDKLIQLMIEKDFALHKNHPKGPYLSDLGHNKYPDAIKNADHWLNRIFKYAEKMPEQLKSNKLSQEGWGYFFESCFYDLRKDILSKKIFVKRDSASPWDSFDPLDGVLRSFAVEQGLQKTFVKDEMQRFSFMRDKVEFLCDLPEWDGVDYVSKYTSCLKSGEFTCDEIAEIFKEWGASIFARIESSKNQNRCIILKGKQNMGKDTFVRSMLEGFDPYYELVSPPSQNKDWLEIVSRLFIVHLEEFDQTAKVDVPFLKSLITQPSTFFRESYGRDPNKKITAPSFISTVNPDDFFRDPTGNRRFIVIPLEGIEFNYPKNISQQVLAQFKAIYDAKNYKCSKDTELKIKAIIDKLTPESAEDWIEELWVEMASEALSLRFNEENKGPNVITQSMAGEIFVRIAKMSGCRTGTIRRILKTKGYQWRDNLSRYWLDTKK
jgi:hypothetical protein